MQELRAALQSESAIALDIAALEMAAIETPGLSADFYYRNTATGVIDKSLPTEPTLDYFDAGTVKLPANGANPGTTWMTLSSATLPAKLNEILPASFRERALVSRT